MRPKGVRDSFFAMVSALHQVSIMGSQSSSAPQPEQRRLPISATETQSHGEKRPRISRIARRRLVGAATQGRPCKLLLRVAATLWQNRGRSEEHTSELQSPFLIS